MVQHAQGSKAPVQKLVDRIAAVFVPVVILIALLTLVAWFVLGIRWHHPGLLSMITVLVIACPCALGLATPTAIMVGVGKGAERGILIKDAQSLETAKRVNAGRAGQNGNADGRETRSRRRVLDQGICAAPADPGGNRASV